MNAPPYLYVCDLYGEIDEEASTADVSVEGVSFRLKKKERGLWGRLAAEGGKDELAVRRRASVERFHAAAERRAAERREETERQKKEASNRKIALDSSKRRYLDQKKEQELAAARRNIGAWQRIQEGAEGGDSDEEEDGNGSDDGLGQHAEYEGRGRLAPADSELFGEAVALPPGVQKVEIEELEGGSGGGGGQGEEAPGAEAEAAEEMFAEDETPPYVPPPRSARPAVQVSFTKLETKTLPARAPREKEISLWKKQNDIDPDTFADAMDVAERQPIFLKERGDKMFRAQNYEGAINAYSRAVQLDGDMMAGFNNRAACHLKLRQFAECAADCATVVERLSALSEEDVAAREGGQAKYIGTLTKALVRRAHCSLQLGDIQQAVGDYESALALDAGNAKLRQDLEEVRAGIRPADGANIKELADARFRSGDIEGAIEAYTLLLKLPGAALGEGGAVAGHSNRAACYLMRERFKEAVRDCDAGMEVLLGEAGSSSRGAAEVRGGRGAGAYLEVLSGREGAGGLAEREKAACSLARLLARRGAARMHLKEYKSAHEDCQAAAGLYGEVGQMKQAQALEADLVKLAAFLPNE